MANKTIIIAFRPEAKKLLCGIKKIPEQIQETIPKTVPTENTLTLGTLLVVLVVVIIYVITPRVLSRPATFIIIDIVRDLGKVFSENNLEFATVGKLFPFKSVNIQQALILGPLRLVLLVVFICILTH